MKKIIPIKEVEKRIFEAHGDTITIDHDTYCGTSKKAVFVDKDYGSWTTWVSNVLTGHGHKKRSIEKSANTCMERYGNTTALGSQAIRAKIEATCLKRYGNKSSQGNNEIREKSKKTMLERYGVDNAQKIPEVNTRTHETNFKRYGVKHPLQSKEIFDRMEATNVKRYGVTNPLMLKTIREKIRKTCLEKYGVENPAQDPNVYQKTLDGLHLVKKIVHWKTAKQLSCKASYEAAFVNWCNKNKIDFDWQVPFETTVLTPSGKRSVYFIDALIKTGEFTNTYVEIKGTWNRKNGHVGKAKWEWFHSEHKNSVLWMKNDLIQLGIL